MAEDGCDFVDLAVRVRLGQDIALTLTVGTVSDVVPSGGGVVVASEGRNSDLSCWSQETVAAFVIRINKANWNPVRVFIQIFAVGARECIALHQETDARQALSIVTHRDLTGQFCTGVVLQNLDQGVGGLDLSLGVHIVPVGDDKVVHHGAGQR